VTRKATAATAIQTTPRMAFNRLSSLTSMSRRVLVVAVALLLVVCVAATSSAAARRRTTRNRTLTLPILMYHRIGRIRGDLAPVTQRLTVTPDDFAAQMRWLKRHGFHAVTQTEAFDALEQGAALPSHPIMVTFDDGYRGVWANALPVLIRLRMPATAYVITSRISNGDPSFLTWGQLRVLERHGVTIGSHTVTHPDLTTLSDPQAYAELRNSRSALEQHLGRPVRWFAYPAGREDARIRGLVHRAGYLLAVTTQPGAAQSSQTPLELHRYEILDSTHVTGLAAMLAGARG
jgi:peptidoglycan/xylan/chitin deacetylase (PgdA/CDA1 family)